jgi:hypothetical protein
MAKKVNLAQAFCSEGILPTVFNDRWKPSLRWHISFQHFQVGELGKVDARCDSVNLPAKLQMMIRFVYIGGQSCFISIADG